MHDNMFPKFNPFPPGVEKQLQENYDRNRGAQEATIKQAEIQKNIEENLNVVIENQQQIINELKNRIDNTNNILERMLLTSENTFASQEDSVIVSKEIYKLLISEDKDGLKEYAKDKGGDILVQGMFLLIQFILAGNIPM